MEKLLIGLGNIGKEYECTRHNFGFLALDAVIEKYNFTRLGEKFSSEVFTGEISGKKILALKPKTYMNNSGSAALAAASFYKIKPENIIVLHDEIDISLGKIKIKLGGGNAGHNGLKSIDATIGNNYWRARLGIGRPENKEFEIADYVLSKFLPQETEIAKKIIAEIVALMPQLITDPAQIK